jgi:serine protease Do
MYVSHRVAIAVLAVTMMLMSVTTVNAQTRATQAKALSSAFSGAAKEAMPAVVSIKVEKAVEATGIGSPMGYNDPFGSFGDDFLRQFFGDRMPQQQGETPRKYKQEGQGSGFIISEDGYILTNNHVVGDVDKITVELQDGRKFENAKLIGTDPGSEVALIKIDGHGFPVLPLGDSTKTEIGDWVIAIGNPFGLNETVTVGVISAEGRSNVHIAAYEDFIQTDAAINPGNSGGPLINLDGQVIGINTAILSQSGGYMGIGFAIPINMARSIEQQLKANGKVTRGYLGLLGQDITPDMADLLKLPDNQGVIVAQVEPGSPADKAGLQTHDVILELNGKKIESYDTFRNLVAMLAPNSKADLLIVRGAKKQTVMVSLGERPMQVASQNSHTQKQPAQEALGMQVQALTQDLAQRFGYIVNEGVIVAQVAPGGAADEAGIQPGDLIQSVNQQDVKTVDDFEKAVANAKGDKMLLRVRRGDFSRYVVIRPKS